MNKYLKAVLDAYDRAVDVPPPEPQTPAMIGDKAPPPPEPYSIDGALSELFLDQVALSRILAIWAGKKNLILQGAPGVGKSFIAKRLAYLLIAAKDPRRIETIQFHQSYSYEDFVQGYRPDGKGGFVLRDGVFHRFCEKANLSPSLPHVFIIDEINRGNLSKILLAQSRYGERVRSQHLYQLITYLQHERMRHPKKALSGMLIYPDVGRSLRLRYRLLGIPVLISTVDLGREWPEIEAELHGLLEYCASAARLSGHSTTFDLQPLGQSLSASARVLC
jgi:hypothetical protein